MSQVFSPKTFSYFTGAHKNQTNMQWFEKNRKNYQDFVREPFEVLIQQMRKDFQKELPGIPIEAKKITRPLRSGPRAQHNGLIKTHTHVTFCQKNMSRFEWNPGIHIQLGHLADDNFVGVGLYMISSRQMSLLRAGIVQDFSEIDAILSDKKLKRVWKGLQGEKFVRFPKGFDPEHESAAYLVHKQFYLGQNFSRAEVASPDFAKKLSQNLKLTIPFLKWIRSTVGVYQRGKV